MRHYFSGSLILDSEMMKRQLTTLIEKEDGYASLVKQLSDYFYIVFLGGAVRDILWSMSDTIRDIDIVLIPRYNCVYAKDKYILKSTISEYNKLMSISFNQFGGYKIKGARYSMDVWLLDDTWAFRNSILPASIINLLYSVYLNIDSYAFNYSECCFVEECNQKKYDQIDILLEQSKCEELNIIRALVFSKKYNLPVSNIIRKKVEELLIDWDEISKFLYVIQEKHYGKILIDREEIEIILERKK